MEVKINELLIYWLLLFKIHLKIKIKYVIVLKLKFNNVMYNNKFKCRI